MDIVKEVGLVLKPLDPVAVVGEFPPKRLLFRPLEVFDKMFVGINYAHMLL